VNRNKRAETPLAHVIDDLRREPLPSVDWEGVEDELLFKIGREAHTQPRRAAGRGLLKWSFAVAACVLGVGAIFFTPAPEAPVAVLATAPVPAAPAATGGVNGDALAVGALVSADTSRVVVTHAAHVTWSLDEGSAAHVESAGAIVALSLDRGAVSAKVEKSLRPETFVVRVENTRIAVHGTEFRVERIASGVRVTVSEGVLGIGPVGGPSFELPAPGVATLNLQGVRTDTRKAASSASKHAGTAEPARPEGEPAAVASVATEPAPEQAPTAAEPAPEAVAAVAVPPAGAAPLVEQAARSVQRCFSAHTLAGGDLRVSVLTKMALRVTNDGKIGDALFEPPLAPDVRECVNREVGAMRFPSSEEGFVATRSLELGH
jgi:hypothetical protein